MSDGAYLIVAAAVAAAFVLLVLGTQPTNRNPHVDTKRDKWHTRNPK